MNAPKGAAGLGVIQGGGKRPREPLSSRDTVIRALIESGVDLLLRRISPARAEEIQRVVDEVLLLFDQVDASPEQIALLRERLDALERLMSKAR